MIGVEKQRPVKWLVAAVAIVSLAIKADARDLSSRPAYELIDRLFSEDRQVREAARDALVRAGDRTVAPALVEVLFFSSSGRADAAAILEKVLGERHGTSYRDWVEAIGRHEEIAPKRGYVAFKGSDSPQCYVSGDGIRIQCSVAFTDEHYRWSFTSKPE